MLRVLSCVLLSLLSNVKLFLAVEMKRKRVMSLEVKMCVCVCVCEREREREREFLEDESIYKQSLSCDRLQMHGIKIKGADVVVSTNHVTFLTNRFPRLISSP